MKNPLQIFFALIDFFFAESLIIYIFYFFGHFVIILFQRSGVICQENQNLSPVFIPAVSVRSILRLPSDPAFRSAKSLPVLTVWKAL